MTTNRTCLLLLAPICAILALMAPACRVEVVAPEATIAAPSNGAQAAPPAAETPAEAEEPAAAPAEAAEETAAPEDTVTSTAVPEDAPEEPVYGDWIVGSFGAEMPDINPITSTDAYAARIVRQVFDSLLERDPVTLEFQPGVAESWEESEDHLEYTFHLREGVVFSDGQPLTAEDVKFTFDKIQDPNIDALHKQNYYQNVERCDVLDPRTVRFTCTKPYFLHLLYLGYELDIMPAHYYGGEDFNAHDRAPLGSGPYKLVEWDTGNRLVLERNEKYWGGAIGKHAYLDKKLYKIITDDNAAFQELLRGGIDVKGLRAEDWVRRANTNEFNARFNKFTYFGLFYSYIGWNTRRPLFEDKRVRRALTMLLDREDVKDTIYRGLARIVTGNFVPGTYAHNPNIKAWPFDPEGAKALLAEAGWADSNSDGILDKDGQDFRFEILLTNASVDGERICTLFQEELRRAGIEMRIRQLEWASMLEKVDTRTFDAVVMGWSVDPDADPYQLWHSSQVEKGSNYVGFTTPEMDEIIETGRVTFDQAKRQKLYRRFHEIMHEEQPYTFLFSPQALVAYDKRFRGVEITPLERYKPNLKVFVPADLQKYPL